MSENARIWSLRILALLIAIALWYRFSLEGRETLTERTVEAAVSYNRPLDFIVLNPVPTVAVRVRASSKKIRQLGSYLVSVQVELTQAEPGIVNVPLSPEAVQLPEGYSVVSIEPDVIRVELDKEVTQRLPVRPQLIGQPAAGVTAGKAGVLPDQVQVTGPQTMLARIASLSTRPISLEGHAATFDETVTVMPPDPLIQIVQPLKVTVTVPLEAAAVPAPAPAAPPAARPRDKARRSGRRPPAGPAGPADTPEASR
jgi:YbbR domain-containing protein